MIRHKTATHKTTSIKTHHTRKAASAGHAQSKHTRTNVSGATIVRGILTSFNNANYTANVLLLEATSTYIQGVPIAYHMDGTSALVNNQCAVLFFDEQNYTDALIIAIYPGAGVGGQSYPPGRVTFVPAFNLINAVTIPNGTTNTYTVTGSHNIPAGALGVLLGGFYTSANTGTYVQIGAHSGPSILTLGNMAVANGYINGTGIVPVDSNGQIDVKANGGDCVVTLGIYGYVI